MKYQAVKDFIERHQIENVRLYDLLTGTDYSDVLKISDAAIVSLIKEGIGLGVPSKIYGYLAAKKPLITIMDASTDIVQQIEENQAGVHIPNDAATQMLKFIDLTSREKLKQMGTKAYELYEKHYTREKGTARYYQYLK